MQSLQHISSPQILHKSSKLNPIFQRSLLNNQWSQDRDLATNLLSSLKQTPSSNKFISKLFYDLRSDSYIIWLSDRHLLNMHFPTGHSFQWFDSCCLHIMDFGLAFVILNAIGFCSLWWLGGSDCFPAHMTQHNSLLSNIASNGSLWFAWA